MNNPGSARRHMTLIAAMAAGASIHDAAEQVGISQAGASKLIEVYGGPPDGPFTYPCRDTRCNDCGRMVERWPCPVCAHRC